MAGKIVTGPREATGENVGRKSMIDLFHHGEKPTEKTTMASDRFRPPLNSIIIGESITTSSVHPAFELSAKNHARH